MKRFVVDARGFRETRYVAEYTVDMTLEQEQAYRRVVAEAAAAEKASREAREAAEKRQRAREAFVDALMAKEASA